MKQDAATSGKADVASEGFATAVDDKDKDDATEAKIQGGALGSSGNSRSLALTAMATVRARRGANELSAAAAANYGRSAATPDGPTQTTMENYQGKLRYDRFVSERLALFVSLSGRRDRFQGLDLRLNMDPGLAYYFIQGPKHQLWGEDDAASVLSEYSALRISITGHTDDIGDRKKNLDLSKDRADAVKTYLVGRGIDEKRIETRGAGPDEPIADNKQAAGRQKNRRIEFKLLQQ